MEYEIFSKRQQRIRGETPGTYQPESIPKELRFQVLYIWEKVWGEAYDNNFGELQLSSLAYDAYKSIEKTLREEYGVRALIEGSDPDGADYRPYQVVHDFFFQTEDTDKVIDVIELSFRYIDQVIRDKFYVPNDDGLDEIFGLSHRDISYDGIPPDEAIDQLNQRFREHSVWYQYESGQIMKVDSQFIHSEAVKPALMNETTTLFERAEDRQLFAQIIIEIIEKKHQKYEREHRESGYERVPLANIHFGIVRTGTGDFAGIGDFYGNTGVPCLQQIAKMRGKPNENLLITAQRMLDLFCVIGEIERQNEETYKLSKDGVLHKHLIQKLASTIRDLPTDKMPHNIKIYTDTHKEIELYKASYALVIGNSNYTEWNPLPGALQDVNEVKDVLVKHGFNVTLKTDLNKGEFEKAVAQFVLKSGKDEDNRLLFYYAGHGHTRKTVNGEDLGYLVMVDAPTPNRDEVGFEVASIDMSWLVTQTEKIQARHVLFMFDSCFSGTIFNVRNELQIPEGILDSVKHPVRQFITAGRAGETVPDCSYFKVVFLDLIQGCVPEPFRDGYITGEELGYYLKNEVPKYIEGQHPQYGKIRHPSLNKGDFVFVLPQTSIVGKDEVNTENFVDIRGEVMAGKYTDVDILLDKVNKLIESGQITVSNGPTLSPMHCLQWGLTYKIYDCLYEHGSLTPVEIHSHINDSNPGTIGHALERMCDISITQPVNYADLTRADLPIKGLDILQTLHEQKKWELTEYIRG